jgi:hypothetical protein
MAEIRLRLKALRILDRQIVTKTGVRNVRDTDVSFPLSPADIELMHRVLNINPLNNLGAETVNTGGNCMNDLYHLLNGKVLSVHEMGATLYTSMQAWDDEELDTAKFVDWDDKDDIHYEHMHVNECQNTDQLTELWEDNCELIFGELGSADELLLEHGEKISIHEKYWVNLFIKEWLVLAE